MPEERSAVAEAEASPSRPMREAVNDHAVYMLDASGRVASWNEGAQHQSGYSAAEIVGKSFAEFHTPEDRTAGLPRRALDMAAQQGLFESEAWRIRKDGRRFWAHATIDPLRTADGALTGFVETVRDLSTRRGTDAKLGSEEQFRLLVQSVTDYAIYMLDAEGRISSWNQGAQRIKGYRADEIIGQHFSRFYTAEDRVRGEPQRALETAKREGRYEKEGFRVRKDGSTFNAHVVIDPIRDPFGRIIGFAKVTRDVTERIKAQRELEQAQEALFQSQKMDAIGQLTGGVAHDFNNLLMAVLASLELVKKRMPDDPHIARLLENAIQGAQRGSALTQRMLSFARRQALDPRPVDLPSLAANMVDLLQRSIGPAVSLRTSFAAPLPPVQADQNQLELALLNLTVNARDASRESGEIEISARAEMLAPGHPTGLPAGRYVCLAVTDHGEGMDAATLARATEPFFTTKGVGKGTGLGLPMVHGMAEQTGGRFVLKSRVGQGTVAEIWLPAAAGAAPGNAEKNAVTEMPQSPRLTVLAVDDDSLVLFNTTAMLEDLGHDPLEARSGREALEILENKAVDLVITDQAMPQMSGLQLIGAIRERWPDLPVILATGYAELPAGGGGDLAKLGKPFGEKELAGAIAKTFSARPRASAI